MKRQFLAPLSLALLLGGCSSLGVGSSDYGCPGMPQGISCKTPRQVYALSQDLPADASPAKPAIATADTAMEGWLQAPASGPLPVLEAPKVLRIWIAPWRDERGDLIWPSYAFSEVTPRRWRMGGASFAGNAPLAPLPLRPAAVQGAAGSKVAAPAPAASPAPAPTRPNR